MRRDVLVWVAGSLAVAGCGGASEPTGPVNAFAVTTWEDATARSVRDVSGNITSTLSDRHGVELGVLRVAPDSTSAEWKPAAGAALSFSTQLDLQGGQGLQAANALAYEAWKTNAEPTEEQMNLGSCHAVCAYLDDSRWCCNCTVYPGGGTCLECCKDDIPPLPS